MKLKHKFFQLIALFCTVGVCAGFTNPQLKELEYLIVAENFEGAKQSAEALLTKPIDMEMQDQVRYFLGLIHLRQGRYHEAESVFLDLSREVMDDHLRDKVALGLMDAHFLSKKYKTAIMTGEKYLKEHPDTDYESMFYFKLARVNLKLANWLEAREYLKEIIKKYPRSFEFHLARQFLEEKQYFSVQVGAFLERSKAERQMAEMKRKNEYVYIVETVDHLNRTFYRVRVGQLASLDDAELLKEKLAELGYPASVYP